MIHRPPHVRLFAMIAVIALAAVPVTADAHSTGASLYATTSPYVIDIGYDPTVFFAGEYARFDFVLQNEKTGKPVSFDQVWVRIKSGTQTQLATGVFHQPFGPTTLLYTFAIEGTYELNASYRDAEGTELAGATFPITVAPQPERSGIPRAVQFALLFVAGVVAGAVFVFLFSKFKNARRS